MVNHRQPSAMGPIFPQSRRATGRVSPKVIFKFMSNLPLDISPLEGYLAKIWDPRISDNRYLGANLNLGLGPRIFDSDVSRAYVHTELSAPCLPLVVAEPNLCFSCAIDNDGRPIIRSSRSTCFFINGHSCNQRG